MMRKLAAVVIVAAAFVVAGSAHSQASVTTTVVAAAALAPVDGRISLVASVVVLIYLPLLTRVPHSVDGFLPMTGAPWVPEILIGGIILAAWGWFWADRRRAHPPAHFAN